MTHVPPQIGMLATVRNRRGIVRSVDAFDAAERGRLHLVHVEYTDAGTPYEDKLVWEREVGASIQTPNTLPDVSRDAPMPPDEFDALVRASRWSAIAPFVDPDGPDGLLTRLPIAAPFHSAIQVEDFQLVPLLKALRMPRVSLLLADDVGLGKTIEAGLILSELLIRRRIRRVLILCPASLRVQWRQELRDKFSLAFDEVDRDRTHALRKRLGMDANPWRTFSRIVTSYDYFKQPDVFEEFRAASRTPENAPHLPWDLLIVDEAHNLTPSPFGEDSELARMLQRVTPLFEHKLFLTATPHNGHTWSFTGLLERLDPVRFSQRSELTEAERGRVEQVLVRRLKREINQATDPPLFADRTPPQALDLKLGPAERRLAEVFQTFRRKVHAVVAQGGRGEQLAGAFAVEVLGKRLLSCPVSFADSWHRYQEGLRDPETAAANEVRAAERAVREEIRDDREAEGRTAHAARTVGAWLKPLADGLREESRAIHEALRDLGLDPAPSAPDAARPRFDARLDALTRWIDAHLRTGKAWRDDERLVIFTEYKTTLDYVRARLLEKYGDNGALRVLFGGMEEGEREAIKAAFNDPEDACRVLLATDAASEGLNLQETARYLLHFDVPWNPARLEQRNGRLDRHGQSRDVTIFHFSSDDEADLRFLAAVVAKVDTIREDLGSIGEIFDAAIQQRLVRGESERDTLVRLDGALAGRTRIQIPRDNTTATVELLRGENVSEARIEGARLKALAGELDLDADTLRDTLEIALGLRFGRPRFEGPDERGRLRLKQPIPPHWEGLIDDALRLDTRGGHKGALPGVVFDPLHFVQRRNGRPVFRPEKDTALLHLAHPLFQRALATFAQVRFPGRPDSATRWTVRRGAVPAGADALLFVTVEELAVNELRETFHHWVRTLQVPVHKGDLGATLPHAPAAASRAAGPAKVSGKDAEPARDLWEEVATDVRDLIKARAETLSAELKTALDHERLAALKRERDRFQSRQGELSALIEQQTLKKLEKDIAEAQEQARQGHLWDPENRLSELLRSQQLLQEELDRRKAHYEQLRTQLARERERVIEHLIPKRYALHGAAQVFPVAVEIRLPERH